MRIENLLCVSILSFQLNRPVKNVYFCTVNLSVPKLSKRGKKDIKIKLVSTKEMEKNLPKKEPIAVLLHDFLLQFKQFLSLSDCMQKELYFAKKNKIYVPSNFMSFPHPTSVHSQGKKLCKVPFFKRCAMGF